MSALDVARILRESLPVRGGDFELSQSNPGAIEILEFRKALAGGDGPGDLLKGLGEILVGTSRRARRWRLLLQLNPGWEEGLLFEQDCGFLYFMIPEEALIASDWSRTFCVIQQSRALFNELPRIGKGPEGGL